LRLVAHRCSLVSIGCSIAPKYTSRDEPCWRSFTDFTLLVRSQLEDRFLTVGMRFDEVIGKRRASSDEGSLKPVPDPCLMVLVNDPLLEDHCLLIPYPGSLRFGGMSLSSASPTRVTEG
jgi:hypothetical protein